jgi:hypothetical protein
LNFLTPVANLQAVSTTPVVQVAKFATGVIDTGGASWLAKNLREFSLKLEMTLILFSGAWGKVIHEKSVQQEISWHYPFKQVRRNSLVCELMFSSPLAWGELGERGGDRWGSKSDYYV